jgi:proteasome lid subunit RPN8/RPN11
VYYEFFSRCNVNAEIAHDRAENGRLYVYGSTDAHRDARRCVTSEYFRFASNKSRPEYRAAFFMASSTGYWLHKRQRLSTIHIAAELRQQIFEQLQGTYPNEGGGFLLGKIQADVVTISDVHPITNVYESEEQFHRYAMTPKDWMALEDEADSKGLTLVGYYHSHPDHPAIPSEFDRVHALPNFRYLITSVQTGRAVDFRAWQLSDDRSRFDELGLQIS